jgi:hypothetical protein
MLRVIYASMIPNESNATASIATYVMLLEWWCQEQNQRTKLGRRRRSSGLGGAVSSLGGPASARAPSAAAAFLTASAVPALAAVPAAPAGSSAVPAAPAAATSSASSTAAAVVAGMVVQGDGPEGFRVEGALLGPSQAAVDPLMAVHRLAADAVEKVVLGVVGRRRHRRRAVPRVVVVVVLVAVVAALAVGFDELLGRLFKVKVLGRQGRRRDVGGGVLVVDPGPALQEARAGAGWGAATAAPSSGRSGAPSFSINAATR